MTDTAKLLLLVAGGAALGAAVMKLSMQPSGEHVKIGQRLLAVGGGVAAGAAAVHFSEKKGV